MMCRLLCAVAVIATAVCGCERKCQEEVMAMSQVVGTTPPMNFRLVPGNWVVLRIDPVPDTDLAQVLLKAPGDGLILTSLNTQPGKYVVGQEIDLATRARQCLKQ